MARVPPIDSKSLVAFVNKFLVDGVKILNDFCVNCDKKMSETARRIDRLEASLGKTGDNRGIS